MIFLLSANVRGEETPKNELILTIYLYSSVFIFFHLRHRNLSWLPKEQLKFSSSTWRYLLSNYFGLDILRII